MEKRIEAFNGVMFNAYPDSIGTTLEDCLKLLESPEFKEVFSLFYLLPTCFNSDLDRGFSIIDYNLNEELVSKKDLEKLKALQIELKFDIVLNHLSVASPQFKDLLKNGEASAYKDFFIDWNAFWEGNGTTDENGIVIPKKEFLDKLFMRKSGLPILEVQFPDGTMHPYWNTFYQAVTYQPIKPDDLSHITELSGLEKETLCKDVNAHITSNNEFQTFNFNEFKHLKEDIAKVIERKKSYLGQMDVNAKSEMVWKFYDETLSKLKSYGCKILRLDAFAYLHKEIGLSNFFNTPGTWEYLERIKQMANKYELQLLPEIHAEYGSGLHKEVANKGYYIYDFFLPGLIIYTLEKQDNRPLVKWINEIVSNGYKTVNMLGCHDGIPVLDLKGKMVNGVYNKGLLHDEAIEAIINKIVERGGRVKDLYGPDGKKISYYQVNATFYSALGEDDQKMLLARAIQLFMPGTPQVWYLDIFGGKNDYDAVNRANGQNHKEINRTTLTLEAIGKALKNELTLNQLKLLKLRNTSKAFAGKLAIHNIDSKGIELQWKNDDCFAKLKVDLTTYQFRITSSEAASKKVMLF